MCRTVAYCRRYLTTDLTFTLRPSLQGIPINAVEHKMIADGLRPEILAIALADLRAGVQASPPGSPVRSNSHVPEGLGSPTRTGPGGPGGPNMASGVEESQQTGTIAGAVAASWGGLTAPAPPPAAEVVAADDPRLAQASSKS